MSGKPSEFRQLSDVFKRLIEGDDFDGLEELFAEDCQLMIPGEDVRNGKKGVGKCFEYVKIKGGYTTIDVKILKMMPLGEDYGFESGTYTAYNREKEVIDEGKYVVLQKRVDGKWVISFDMFNSNKPSGGLSAHGFQGE